MYSSSYGRVIPNMVKGAIFVADNAINHAETLKTFIDTLLNDESVDAMIAPIGKEDPVCRKR